MPTSPWNQHRSLWHACRKCDLCENRTNVVLARGTLPADVAFIGEAPGVSEDVLGRPFVGPAGQLLNKIIKQVMTNYEANTGMGSPTTAFTNLVACLPDKSMSNHAPPDEAIKACHNRLRDFILICKPKLVVCVGALATKWVAASPYRERLGLGNYPNPTPIVNIVHPAAVLRANVAAQGLMIQKCVVTIANAIEEL